MLPSWGSGCRRFLILYPIVGVVSNPSAPMIVPLWGGLCPPCSKSPVAPWGASLPSTSSDTGRLHTHLGPVLTGFLPEAPGQLVVMRALCCTPGFLSLASS